MGFVLSWGCFFSGQAIAFGPHTPSPGLEQAVEYLCGEVMAGQEPDPARMAPIIAHVRARGEAAHSLAGYASAPGSYQGFEIRMPMQRLLRYLYNPEIPQEVLKSFSIRSSVWTTSGSAEEERRLWANPWPGPEMVVVRGEQYDQTTADLSTGGCYGMHLQRVLIFVPDEMALLSVSVQTGPSEVGTKGYLLGRDQDSRYVYSADQGLTRAGLGWVSSRILTNVSIGVYLAQGMTVQSGVFQWMRAGWSGMSVIKESHIKDSLARYRERMGAVLHLPGLPLPEDMEALFREFDGKSEADLRRDVRPVLDSYLEQARRENITDAVRILEDGYAERLHRGELIGLLMRERLFAANPSF